MMERWQENKWHHNLLKGVHYDERTTVEDDRV